MPPVPAITRPRPTSALAAIAALCVVHVLLLARRWHDTGQDFDALHLYFPLAKGLLDRGWRFLLSEESLRAPLLSYAIPAFVGPSLPLMKAFNAGLSALTLVLVARSAWLMHSVAAAVAAAAIYCISPVLQPFLATAITEPAFIFFCAAWLWAHCEWESRGNAAWAYASALMLAMAAMTRATAFYWLIAFPALWIALSWRPAQPWSRARRFTLAAAYGVALLVPLAFILKNVHLFGFPFFATGAGNALYLGNDPVTGGYDPNYLGIGFDVGGIARDESHLSLHAERLLGGVARMLVHHASPGELLRLHVRKLFAFVFVTNADPLAVSARPWRIATLFLALAAFRAIPTRGMRLALFGTPAYFVLVHIPVLYTHRYSVGALDLWLSIASAIGLCHIATQWPGRRIAAFGLAVAAAIGLGFAWLVAGGLPQPDYFRGPRVPVWQGAPRKLVMDPQQAIDFAVDTRVNLYAWNSFVLAADLAATAASPGCNRLGIAYRFGDSVLFESVLRLELGGAPHRYVVPQLPVFGHTPATISLHWECPAALSLDIRALRLVAPVAAIGWREEYLHEKPLFDVPLER